MSKERAMYHEQHTHGLGVAYYRPAESKSPAGWAEHYGQKTRTAIHAHRPLQDVEYYARLAGTFGLIALEQREQVRELAKDILDQTVAQTAAMYGGLPGATK